MTGRTHRIGAGASIAFLAAAAAAATFSASALSDPVADASAASKLKLSAKPTHVRAGKTVTVKATGRNKHQGFVTTYVDSRDRACRKTEGDERARGAGVRELTGTYTGVPDAPAGSTNRFSFTLHFTPSSPGHYRLCSYLGKIARKPEARAQATVTAK